MLGFHLFILDVSRVSDRLRFFSKNRCKYALIASCRSCDLQASRSHLAASSNSGSPSPRSCMPLQSVESATSIADGPSLAT